jgi:hypothetical protein
LLKTTLLITPQAAPLLKHGVVDIMVVL